MNLNGIGYPTRPLTNAATTGTAANVGTPAQRTAVRPPPPRPESAAPVRTPVAAPTAAQAQAAGVEPPAGTDPALWSVLSAEERGFFAKLGAMGPLTYGRATSTSATMPGIRGGRLDVKA
jgi:hypothetical protein